jgi:prolyl-tRNA synthetase
MRWTQSLIPTQKETPADAQIVSHQLMLRAGLIRQLTAGVYEFLPLGLRSLHKAAAIVREEMDAIGCAEVLLPSLQPIDLWRTTGRDVSYGENLMQLKDRHGRNVVLGPTHEEVITELVRGTLDSYKQLPLSLYQIQTKFRDEYRPRFGLLRVREFLMKDAYSFDADSASLDRAYEKFFAAYQRIFARCGVRVQPVEAESGPIGGSASHEFMALCSAGEDTVVTSDKDNYAANLERAEIGTRAWSFGGEPSGEYERVHTPGLPGIVEVAKFLRVEPRDMLKTLVFRVKAPPQPALDGGRNESLAAPKWLVAVVRGDHDVNESKLARAARENFHVDSLVLEDTPDVRAKWAIGFVGPDAAVKDFDTVVIVDPDAAQPRAWVTGANAIDYHARNFNWFRESGDRLADPRKTIVADIRNAAEGDPSPKNDGGVLRIVPGIELGHLFKLGTLYSEKLGATYKDAAGQERPIVMGCYGIGIARILIAAIEQSHDSRGIVWPAALAPYSCVITPIKYEGDVKSVSDRLHDELNAAGIDTLLDDRPDVRAGAKFADADLIGFPIRINVGDRGLKEGMLEVKLRPAEDVELVPPNDVVSRVQAHLRRD